MRRVRIFSRHDGFSFVFAQCVVKSRCGRTRFQLVPRPVLARDFSTASGPAATGATDAVRPSTFPAAQYEGPRMTAARVL